jgi:hypothetical protein
MANALYTKGKEGLLDGSINLETHTIKVQLIDTADYTVNLSTHDNFDDVPSAARVGSPVALASKTFTNGVFDAADVTLTSVTGDPSEALILYKDTGTESTSRLFAYIDTATGLPVTPTGVDIAIQWNASGIFSL